MAAIDKVRILVVGDSGVGKTSLTHLICQNEPIMKPSWTVGCSVDVKLHEYKEGLPQQKTFFIELWDVGGSSSHRNTRSILYNPVHGIILVHDLTNRKSQQNLQKWLAEILNHEGSGKVSKHFDDFDPEQYFGSNQVPLLVIGTKLDMAGVSRIQRAVTFADECGADEILLDCRQPNALAAGSSSAVKLTRFFDKVIEKKFYSTYTSPTSYADKRRSFIMSQPHKGKLAVSCSHASVLCYIEANKKTPMIVNAWLRLGQKKIVLKWDRGLPELIDLARSANEQNIPSIIVRDAGLTEVTRGTVTAVGIGPASSEEIDMILPKLKLM